MKIVITLSLFFIAASWGHPMPEDDEVIKAPLPSSFASEASQLIAMEMLKFNKDIDANQVHSPLGVATILGVLAEAATGETYEEFSKVFGFPVDHEELRSAFSRILGSYQNINRTMPIPSIYSGMYIYRNNQAQQEYKKLLEQHYFVEVKDVAWDDTSSPEAPLHLEEVDPIDTSNSKDVIGFETLKRINVDLDDAATTIADTYGEEVINKEASKFDRDIDDRQYVEKPVALAEAMMAKKEAVAVAAATELAVEKLEKPDTIEAVKENLEDSKQQNKRSDTDTDTDASIEENETVQEDEKLRKNGEQNVSSGSDQLVPTTGNEPEKVRLPLQKLENVVKNIAKEAADEIMIALESHLSSVSRVYGSRSLFRPDDIASALSATSIKGRKFDAKSKLLLFNGMYYRGSWARPFYQLRDGIDEFFFMTNDDAVKSRMMHTKGQFNVTEIPHLKARLLLLPYEIPKYGLAILLPDEAEGLTELISKLQTSDFKYACENLKLQDVHVTLPKFEVQETTSTEAMIKQLGLKRIFTPDAELNLLSNDEDVHVEEIVQFVNVRVDQGGSSAHSLTGAQGRSSTANPTDAPQLESEPEPEPEPELEPSSVRFEVNRPFAYFVMDLENQFVLASGKVHSPEFEDSLPSVSVEVELEQAA